MYLNIILSLIFLVFAGNLWANLTTGLKQLEEHEKAKEYQRKTNEEVIELHWRILEEIEKLTKGVNDERK